MLSKRARQNHFSNPEKVPCCGDSSITGSLKTLTPTQCFQDRNAIKLHKIEIFAKTFHLVLRDILALYTSLQVLAAPKAITLSLLKVSFS